MTSERPSQAVILAGGRGTRLLPLTISRPKPMILFHGRPFLEYLIEQLREQGFKRILLLLGYLPEIIKDYFEDGRRFGVQIDYHITSVDDETGARLKSARDRIDEVFFLLYCDNYLPFSFEAIWSVWQREQVSALVTVYANKEAFTKSNLRVAPDGRVEVYDKSREARSLQGVDVGYILAKRDVLDLIPEENVSFEATVYPELIRRGLLHAFVTQHRYYSVGDHKRLPQTEKFLARQPTVLLDRDGVLNEKMPPGEYVRKWAEWRWIDGSLEALRLFKEAGFRVIVISNQAGVGRGMMTEADVTEIHTRMQAEANGSGGRIDAIYYCPHDWNSGCTCRKPLPGMFFLAQRDLGLDLTRCLYIGDDERDEMAARAAQCQFQYVTSERGLLAIARSVIANAEKNVDEQTPISEYTQ